jgi:hypothetical protein
LVRFFDAYQRNELGRAAGETLLILAFFAIQAKEIWAKINGQSRKHSPSATSFLLISVKRNGSKEKRFPVQSQPGDLLTRGFF